MTNRHYFDRIEFVEFWEAKEAKERVGDFLVREKKEVAVLICLYNSTSVTGKIIVHKENSK